MKDETKRLEERLGEFEPAYKSADEARIGRLMDRHGIDFFYEMPLLIYDQGRHQIWRPGFTLPAYGGILVEYAISPTGEDSHADIKHKRDTYNRNGVPALFVSPEDLTRPNWDERLLKQIEHLGEAYSVPPGLTGRYVQPAAGRSR